MGLHDGGCLLGLESGGGLGLGAESKAKGGVSVTQDVLFQSTEVKAGMKATGSDGYAA